MTTDSLTGRFTQPSAPSPPQRASSTANQNRGESAAAPAGTSSAASRSRPTDAVAKTDDYGITTNREITNERVVDAAGALSRRLAHVGNRSIRFHMHDETGQMSVDIVDDETDTVIRSIPPEESLDRLAKLEKYLGLLFDRNA